MKAVIMAGGFGTRLRPVTNRVPKPMGPVVNIPMMEHIINSLKDIGITEVVSVLYFQPDVIINYFGDGSKFGIKMQYLTTKDNYGTAGSVRMAKRFLNERFLVLSGDVLTEIDLKKAIGWHEKKKAKSTIVLTRVENPLAFGIVITDEQGRITRFLEKPSWGQVFSDTINTGMYIFEPEILDYIPERTDFDFSKDLFPTLMKKGKDIHGYVAKGYWLDIGDIKAYRLANMDVIKGLVHAKIPGNRIDVVGRDIWIGEGSKTGEDCRFEGGVLIGRNCTIGKDVYIYNSVIGDNCVIKDGAHISHSVLWEDCTVGSEAYLEKNVICRNVKIMSEAYIGEEAVIGDDCKIGAGVTVKPGVKMWPGKTLEDGAVLGSSLVWGDKWNRQLFSAHGIVGLANFEITPEFATKVGAAMGAAFGRGSVVATARDGHGVSRLINRAFISGLLSVGVNVKDLRNLPAPVLRYQINARNIMGGVHTHMSPYDPNFLDVKFVDEKGMDFTVAKQKAIERNFFREDFPRSGVDEVGELTFPHRVLEYYKDGLVNFVDSKTISKAGLKIVLDYSYGSASNIFPKILSEYGCEVIALNAFEDSKKLTKNSKDFINEYNQLAEITGSLKADFGIMMDSGAEKVFLVDENGTIISKEDAQAMLVYIVCQTRPGCTIGVPVYSSERIKKIVDENNCNLIYTKINNRNMMQTAEIEGVKLVADGEGGFIFPEFQTWFDGMASISIILNLIANKEFSFSKIRKKLPEDNRVFLRVPCAKEEKGTVMRNIMANCSQEGMELIDGVKIKNGKTWVLLIPDTDKPYFNIYAEGQSKEESGKLVDEYRVKIDKWKK